MLLQRSILLLEIEFSGELVEGDTGANSVDKDIRRNAHDSYCLRKDLFISGFCALKLLVHDDKNSLKHYVRGYP